MSVNLGKLADQLYAKNEEIAAANARVKELEGEKTQLETKLLQSMKSAGTDIVRGDTATVSISETVRPKIDDFEAFASFVLRKKAIHLFERRVAANAYREMKESLNNKPIPGISEFTHERLNVRRC